MRLIVPRYVLLLVNEGTHVKLGVLLHVGIFQLFPTTQVVKAQTFVHQLNATLATYLPKDGRNISLALAIFYLASGHV